MSKEEKEKKEKKSSNSSKKNSSRLENKTEEKKENQVKKGTKDKENTTKKEEKTSPAKKSSNVATKKKTTTKKIEEKIEVEEVEEVVENHEDIDSDLEDFGEISPSTKEDSSSKKKKKKIKKSDLILIIGLIIVVILGCFMMKGQKEEVSYQLPLTLEGEAGLQLLSYSDYQKKIDNGDAFVVVLSRESCSHCANFMPVAKEFASSKNLPMYYVDTDTFSEDDWSSFEKSNTFLKKSNGNWGTPTTIVLAGREAVDYIEGETTADKLQELYDKYFDLNQE